MIERELMKNITLISNPVLKSELKQKKKMIFDQKVEKNRLTQLQKELLGGGAMNEETETMNEGGAMSDEELIEG